MEDNELIVDTTGGNSQETPEPVPQIDIEALGEAMAAAGRR